jgi:steroid 5-alpha reductase family enzyme
MLGGVFLTVLAALSVYMLAFWLVSLVLRDVSIVDIGWGLGFVVVTWVARSAGAADDARSMLQAIFVTLWGLRLCGYLLVRNWGQPEDYRYAAMRRRIGPAYTFLSIVMVFGLQGVLMLAVSLPVQAVQGIPSTTPLGPIDFLAVAMFGIGFFFEVMGDLQLTRFRANPENQGQVLDTGVWAWTRHPNYFGDALQWWAFGLFALSVPGAAWTLIGPMLMTFLLLRISGVHLLERGLRKRKPDYEAYVERTPAFIPRPPRRSA